MRSMDSELNPLFVLLSVVFVFAPPLVEMASPASPTVGLW